MYSVLLLVVLLVIYLTVEVTLVLLRNRRAHKFFQKKSPNLPVVPGASILDGHALRIIGQPKNWKIIEDLHEKYGPTFGYYMCDQPWVSTKDLDLIKLIQVDEAHKHMNRPYLGLPFDPFNHSFWHLGDFRWRQARRTISSAISNHAVRSDSITREMESVVDQILNAFRNKAGSATNTAGEPASFEIEIRDYSERYTLAIVLANVYDKHGLVDFDGDQDAWTHLIHSSGEAIVNPAVALSVGLPFLRPLCKLLVQYHGTGQSERRMMSLIDEAIERRKKVHETGDKGDGATRSLLNSMIDDFLNKKIDYKRFTGDLVLLQLAAISSTADTISCLIWQLARNPDVQDKLRRAFLVEGIDADYVSWCIHEACRFHPGAPLAVGRVLGEDVSMNGLFLAKGTTILPTIHGIQHDPKIWPEPERFLPERWRDRANFHPAQFMAFGLGPRNCVGGKMAMHEMKLFMCRILSEYRIETCDRTPDEWRFSSQGMLYCLNDDPLFITLRPIKV